MGREYDDNRCVGDALEDMLPGQGLASGLVDIDDADGSDVEPAFGLAGADLVGEDRAVPVIAKRADEFTCSSCFLTRHVSRAWRARRAVG